MSSNAPTGSTHTTHNVPPASPGVVTAKSASTTEKKARTVGTRAEPDPSAGNQQRSDDNGRARKNGKVTAGAIETLASSAATARPKRKGKKTTAEPEADAATPEDSEELSDAALDVAELDGDADWPTEEAQAADESEPKQPPRQSKVARTRSGSTCARWGKSHC
jgi:hypothetical protein